MQCPRCGAEVTGKFCEYCGYEMPRNAPDTVNNDNSHNTIINNYYQSSPTSVPTKEPQPIIYTNFSHTDLCLRLKFAGYGKAWLLL